MTDAGIGPTSARDRIEEMDVLRGVALYGVFLANLVGFSTFDIVATGPQLLSLPTAPLDFTLLQFVLVFVNDKANTLFAFLFGLGFYLQMQRAQARGANFERIYLRRLTVLLCIGLVHILLVWNWDILHLYAIAGFVLFALRRLSTRTLLIAGLVCTLFSYDLPGQLVAALGLTESFDLESTYSESAVLARQELAHSGDYPGLVAGFADFLLSDYILSGLLSGWVIYALGRFMLGAWVGRKGWLHNVPQYLPGFRRVLRVALPLGLLLECVGRLVGYYSRTGRLPEWDQWSLLSATIHQLAVPSLAAGYLCAIVVGLHHPRARTFLAPFGHVGRMALSNYVAQSFVIAFVLFGVGPGLALAGRIGVAWQIVIVTVAFTAQVIVSRWWLARFRFGPLEWLWRGLTYGAWPAFRRVDEKGAGAVSDPAA